MAAEKIVLLTGATGLIGKVLLRSFLANGYSVIATSTSEEKINGIYTEFAAEKTDGRLHMCNIDLLADNAMERIACTLSDIGKMPHYLVNNARSLTPLQVADYRRVAKQQWQAEFELDVIVPYRLAMLLLGLKNSALEAVVNIASMYGFLGYNDFLCEGSRAIAINYGVCKAALIQLTRELAVRMASNGVRVNAVSYGGVEGRADAAFQKRYAQLCPDRKMLGGNELAGHVLYLCSDASRGMTGHNLVVDGGFSAW